LEGTVLGNLGAVNRDSGQVSIAIDRYEQALAICREFGNREGESIRLSNLGLAWGDLGAVSRAIDYHEQALTIAREIADKPQEASELNNLGLAYLRFGQMSKAIDFCEQSLTIVRELGDRYNESLNLSFIATARMILGEPCLTQFEEALRIAEEIGNAEARTRAAIGLTGVRLLAGQLEAAQGSAEAAREANHVLQIPATCALLGVVSLRRDAKLEAQSHFAEAIRHAEALLTETSQLYAALEAKGLSLCGLALCEDSRHLVAAQDSYRAARTVTSADGVVRQALLMFDALAVADTTHLLATVRPLIAGQST
jgi:tetratricopeptide (TPR) repeat protein